MSVLVVGMSHRSAPVTVLERAAVSGDELTKLLGDVFHAEHVAGTFVVSTCNRVEVYAEVGKFHAGVSAICELLARHSGVALSDLTPHLYVHYEDGALQHLLSMTCGLESMVVGESQILGQVRGSLALARRQGTLGRALDDLGALALRAAKRAHAETGIDRSGPNLVSVGLSLAAGRLDAPAPARVTKSRGPAAPGGSGGSLPRASTAPDPARPLAGFSVLVVGAGSMSSLAVATAARLGAAGIVVANRTQERAKRLAGSVRGTTADLGALPPALAAADLVVSCTGATGLVITADMVGDALRLRGQAGGTGRPLVLLDLALPRDVDPSAADLPGVSVLGLDSLREAGATVATAREQDVAAVRAIVAEELAARWSARQAARVAPTVVALRAKAVEVVEAELARLAGRLGRLDDRAHAEITQAMHRVVDKLLHAPTVRVKELAGSPGGDSYEAALRVLFDLDPGAVEAVTRADAGPVTGGPGRGGGVGATEPLAPPGQEAR
jgi:glutamyl-tRNA reductase